MSEDAGFLDCYAQPGSRWSAINAERKYPPGAFVLKPTWVSVRECLARLEANRPQIGDTITVCIKASAQGDGAGL